MFRRYTVLLLLVGLVLPAGAQYYGDTYIRCESGWFGSYKRCSVPAMRGYVELVRERSNHKCQLGYTWGFDRDGIWVDDGCKADFRVGGGRGGPGGMRGSVPGPDEYYGNDPYDRDRGMGTGTKVIIGAVAAAAIIGAILATTDQHPTEVEVGVVVPDWAVGRFRGYSPKTDRNVDVTIEKAGAVTGMLDQDVFTGRVTNDHKLYMGDVAFSMKQMGWGFVATAVDDPEDIVSLRRQ
jgi:hypothetical protein